jgi:hypothetical protein
MKEPGGNVYENKGPVFQSPARSGNPTENKDGYASEAGILLKRKQFIRNSRGVLRLGLGGQSAPRRMTSGEGPQVSRGLNELQASNILNL